MLRNLNRDKSVLLRAKRMLISPDSGRDEMLHQLVELTSNALQIPACFITIPDDQKNHIIAFNNKKLANSHLTTRFCCKIVERISPLIVPDVRSDTALSYDTTIADAPDLLFFAGVPLRNHEGVVLGTLCVADTTPHTFNNKKFSILKSSGELVESFLEFWHSAGLIDPLTELPNQQCLIRDLQNLTMSDDSASGQIIVLECFDIGRTYEFVRSMSFGPVERLLRNVVYLLRLHLCLTSEETLYSIAVGRFALLTSHQSRMTANSVSRALNGLKAELGNGLAITIKPYAGEIFFSAGHIPAQELIRRALSALHEAIALNLPAFNFSEKEDQRRTQEFMLMTDLSYALKHDSGLWLAYQPKICLHTGKPVGLEALIRWCHPIRGELLPSEFVSLAEQTELLTELTSWIVDRVIKRLSRLQGSAIQLPVTINISERDFARNGFAEQLSEKMMNQKLPLSLFGIECLETEQILDNPVALYGLDMLKSKGVNISLDDFGAGYSNISYLRRMPLDTIKLDRSLIIEITLSKESRIIAKSIIDMLKKLHYTVLAEGVEDASTVEALKELGCDQAQGYYFCRPLSEIYLDKILEAKIDKFE